MTQRILRVVTERQEESELCVRGGLFLKLVIYRDVLKGN